MITAIVGIFIGLVMCCVVIGAGYLIENGGRIKSKKKPARRVLVNGQEVSHCPRCGDPVTDHSQGKYWRCHRDLLHLPDIEFHGAQHVEADKPTTKLTKPQYSNGLYESRRDDQFVKDNTGHYLLNLSNKRDLSMDDIDRLKKQLVAIQLRQTEPQACRHELEYVYTHIPGTDNEEYLVGAFCKKDGCDYQDADPSWVSLGFPSGASTVVDQEHG